MPRWLGAHLTSGESQRVVEADEGLVTAAAALDSAALSASVVVQKLGACGEDDDAKHHNYPHVLLKLHEVLILLHDTLDTRKA